jgi:hypothetical protein
VKSDKSNKRVSLEVVNEIPSHKSLGEKVTVKLKVKSVVNSCRRAFSEEIDKIMKNS